MRARFRGITFVILSLALWGALFGVASAQGGGKTSSSLGLVLLNSNDGQAHYGQTVTFDVSTTATDRPYVRVNCYQGGSLVYAASAGFFADYPWPWARNFTLSSRSWTGGAADCTAELYYTNDGWHFKTLASLGFHVYA